jgi:hypothetical protein
MPFGFLKIDLHLPGASVPTAFTAAARHCLRHGGSREPCPSKHTDRQRVRFSYMTSFNPQPMSGDRPVHIAARTDATTSDETARKLPSSSASPTRPPQQNRHQQNQRLKKNSARTRRSKQPP